MYGCRVKNNYKQFSINISLPASNTGLTFLVSRFIFMCSLDLLEFLMGMEEVELPRLLQSKIY